MQKVISILAFLILAEDAISQLWADTTWWHHQRREIRYHPEGTDFVMVNGKRRFIRALYGTNTAFRVEAGDLPEFALYMPGMGGNFKFGIIAGNKSKWLTDATKIKAVYRPGSMLYEVRDPILGNGVMYISILALADREGMIIKTNFSNVVNDVALMWVFGGASGKKFSRDGDVGADPESSFYLHAENCKNNYYRIGGDAFQLIYNAGKTVTEEERYEVQNKQPASQFVNDPNSLKQIRGIFPAAATIKLSDASIQKTPLALFSSEVKDAPVVSGKIEVRNEENYFLIENPGTGIISRDDSLEIYFAEAEMARKRLVERVKVVTPDKYINTIGGALSIAADAIWEDPSYLHGAVAWRMRLNAWRGPYVADPLGWHDRARKHFSSYALSQITEPPVAGVVMDTALHLARHLEKVGTALFSDGYISRNPNGDIRAHHYDMNLVFIDQLLNHFNWTGDTSYVRQMFPLIKRHLAWEKRNFDSDGDGLYDAYAAIWASDALQYSGGGVTHSSAYNYRANKMAAELARIIGEDGHTYEEEADKIYAAVQKNLWMPLEGAYAEYKDLLGKKLIHPSPGLWTIYQAIDSKIAGPFEAYLNLRYVDDRIPHIPVKAKGFNEKGLYLLSTTDWQPYTWSINNVALAENLNTALAYWQGNRSDEAYRLWRSAIIETMYMSASPGGFEQLSYYDAMRGELYRDFADPIGVAARSLVEGLFGIEPDALHDTLTIRPGLPTSWNYARLQIPDVHFAFKRNGNTDDYQITQFFKRDLVLKFLISPPKDGIASIKVNGKEADWQIESVAIGKPEVIIHTSASHQYNISIQWKGNPVITPGYKYEIDNRKGFQITWAGATMLGIYDPSKTMGFVKLSNNKLIIKAGDLVSWNKIFVHIKQGSFNWWQPIDLYGKLIWEPWMTKSPAPLLHVTTSKPPIEKVDLTNHFNDKISNIFKHEYLSPRPSSPTLQLPTQGIGNWCYPLVTASIDDHGLRKMAGTRNEIRYNDRVSFSTPSDTTLNNIVFTSQWDNFPDSIIIPLSGTASEIYLLMAGTTNPMQSHITNGMVTVNYEDQTADTLRLDNPDNWWPIEQDYYIDGFAFNACCELPDRLYLKEAKFGKELPSYSSIKGFTNRAVDGGAATVLSMYLNDVKTLKSLTVYAIANDVVIGLMAATLVK